MAYTLGPMYLYREYFKAKVYPIWVHGPLGYSSKAYSEILPLALGSLGPRVCSQAGDPYSSTLKGTLMVPSALNPKPNVSGRAYSCGSFKNNSYTLGPSICCTWTIRVIDIQQNPGFEASSTGAVALR